MKQLLIILCLLLLPHGNAAQQKEFKHACCYCPCYVADYHKGCHGLCELPIGELKGFLEGAGSGPGYIELPLRAFSPTESKMCIELCMLKKEGRAHLKHRHED